MTSFMSGTRLIQLNQAGYFSDSRFAMIRELAEFYFPGSFYTGNGVNFQGWNRLENLMELRNSPAQVQKTGKEREITGIRELFQPFGGYRDELERQIQEIKQNLELPANEEETRDSRLQNLFIRDILSNNNLEEISRYYMKKFNYLTEI